MPESLPAFLTGCKSPQFFFILRYFCFVASPPRRWRSALFCSSTDLTAAERDGDILPRRSVMSLCTVDLLTPNSAAAPRTVSFVRIMYSAIVSHLSRPYSSVSILYQLQCDVRWYRICRTARKYAHVVVKYRVMLSPPPEITILCFPGFVREPTRQLQLTFPSLSALFGSRPFAAETDEE